MRRLATETDLDAVFAIYMHERVIPYLGFDPMPRAEFVPLYRELLASRSFFIHEVDGRVAGFYRISRLDGRARHVAALGTLAVDPAFQGRGIGRTMIGEAIEALRAAGVLRVELLVEADNPRAIRFYESLGFEHEGTMRQAYKRAGEDRYVDERVMALLLEPA